MGLGDILDFKTQICLMEIWNRVQLLYWTVLIWIFESTQKMWTILFKCGQYCSHFLEICMNIQVYPENVNNVSINIQVNTKNVFWKFGLKTCFWMGFGDISDFKTQTRLMKTWNRVKLLRWCIKESWWNHCLNPVAWIIKF